MATSPLYATVTESLDPLPQLLVPANETSTDEKYLAHEFITYQGWWETADGYTPPESREAVLAHLRGWMYESASLARHCLRQSYILGALARRSAPTLRTQWSQGGERGPKWARTELGDVWTRQFRPGLEEKLRDVAMLGGSILHIHWIDDVKAGAKRPRVKRWPHEAIWWRAEAPGFPGGYYAITADSGFQRIVPGDGHWLFIAHGERWHEFGAVLSVGEIFPPSKLAERDEANLSAAAGSASPYAVAPLGVPVGGQIDPNNPAHNEGILAGQALQKTMAGLGRARTGAVFPNGTEADVLQIVSDTEFFDRYSLRQLVKIGYAILGIPSPGPGAASTYTPIVGWSVDEALVDKDHEAIVRAWDDGIARPFCDVNGADSDVHLVGERYANPIDRAKAEAEKAEAEARTAQAKAQMAAAGRAEEQARRALYLKELAAEKDLGASITQPHADALALRYEVVPYIVPATPSHVARLDLAPTDLAKVVTVDEARASRDLPAIGDGRGTKTIGELDAAAKVAAKAVGTEAADEAPPAGKSGAPADAPMPGAEPKETAV